MSPKSWKIVPFVACLSIVGACGGAEEGTAMQEVGAPASTIAGSPSKPMTGSAGAAGMKAPTTGAPKAGSSGGTAGTVATTAMVGAVGAVAMIEPFMAGGATTAPAGAAGAGAGGSASTAGTGGHAATAGTGSTAGTGGKAGAGGTGSGSGFAAAVSGTAEFSKVGTSEVDVTIEVTGCEDGKSYPVHIHEGTSCDSVATQGAHWGAPQMGAAGAGGSAAGAAGSSAGAGGSAGHDASHAGGAGSAAGAGGAAAPGATSFMYRGEGITDIKCMGTTGKTSAKRNSFDKRVLWTLGTMSESDVVGHVVVVHDGATRIACGKIVMK